jgi:hypothetical protein
MQIRNLDAVLGAEILGIELAAPDEVWWVPTERFLICDEGVRPLNFAG